MDGVTGLEYGATVLEYATVRVRDEHGYQPPTQVSGVGATRVRVRVGGGLDLVPVGHPHQYGNSQFVLRCAQLPKTTTTTTTVLPRQQQ